MPDQVQFHDESSDEMRSSGSAGTAAPAHGPPGTTTMEHWISYVLRWGVILAATIVLIGAAVFLIAGPAPRDPHSLHQLTSHEFSNRSSLSAKVTGLKHGRGLAIVDVGLMVLILTPVIRVAMTFVLFFKLRDWLFTIVTAIVLSILLLGISGAGV